MFSRAKAFFGKIKYLSIFIALLHIAGFLSSIEAVMSTRTPQGSVAWVISLNTFPSVALPAYWVFGRSKFNGYVKARQVDDSGLAGIARSAIEAKIQFRPDDTEDYQEILAVEKLAKLPILSGNETELLIDGENTFDSIFKGIDQARNYILVQFFIVTDDNLGRELQRRLIKKAREGVKVYFLYDEVGSYGLPASYIDQMREEGIEAVNFHSRKGPRNRFQINFRNHRKIVLVDGLTCWIGGHNVGDAYLGRGGKFSHWRDTHLKITGPAALAVQLSFLEDFHWATDKLIALDWEAGLKRHGDKDILIVPSGPADQLETAGLMFSLAINSARRRIWIASPYFVPDNAIVGALELAALRGVDVRILIPDEPDHRIVYWAAFSYIQKFEGFPNVKFYRYTKGFMHQKTILVDDMASAVGTANFDNRSFRLNFELTALVMDRSFANEIEEMFERDFLSSEIMEQGALAEKPFWFQLLVRLARLTAPML